MTYPELRQKIEQQLAQLPPDQLFLVSDFLDSLQGKSTTSEHSLHRVEQSDPWVEFAGMFKDDPLFDEFVEDMAAYRRELDAEVAANEIISEERQSV
ncbi:hypothetical protein [Iningainema tapete]|uniref:DUF2281 domain-containing protein n=1 Tax=Iningainema tapete BLCC-T55 TaxID=2748662 RepID=A0A8J7CG13_9CYAN|nr:hypothetical protein [Iningainema tapete]MBD2775710.1 hypothetical protein [Iningainema tapete BLCC-T55]